jgi:hypothetical protein
MDSVRNNMSSKHNKEFFECFEEFPSSQPSGDTEEVEKWELDLGTLILRLQDGNIEKKDFVRLENQILTDARASRYYVEIIHICAGLHLLLGKKQDFSNLRSLLPV